ncbi:MAG: NUDIX pyrophosphatase [Ktedonobacterales bacterium]
MAQDTQDEAKRDTTPTHVVTCFLLRQDRGRAEVLLVRRSQRVRTYRGAWGGVSGYVEPGVEPLEQAYTELREEASLTRDDVQLLQVGAALPLHDDTLDQSWVVHPFLFALHANAADRVQTDWEAVEMRWATPNEVATLPTVPKLAEALALVYPPSSQATEGAGPA